MRLCLRSTVLQGAGLGSGGARQGLLGQQDLQFLPEEPGLSSVDSRGTEVFFSRVGQGQSTGCSLEEWRPGWRGGGAPGQQPFLSCSSGILGEWLDL